MTESGAVSAAQSTGTRTFDGAGKLSEFRADGPGSNKFKDGAPSEFGYDGVVTWGRWMNGKSDMDLLKGDLEVMHYFAFTGTPSIPVVKAYASFASTAPVLTSSSGNVLAVGATNSATGTLNVNFTGPAGGTATYALQVPISGNTFSLTGTATQSGTYGFVGRGVVSSSLLSLGCLITCSGALPGGNSVQGAVGGTGNTRAGIDYGFNSLAGKVTGAIVFKQP